MKIIDNMINGFSSMISVEETKGNNKNLIEEIFNETKKYNFITISITF